MKKHLFFVMLIAVMSIFAAACAEAQQKNQGITEHALMTKFGELAFYENSNTPGPIAKIIKLNGKTLLQAASPKDENAFRAHYIRIIAAPFGSQYADNQTSDGRYLIKRELLAIGEDANCFKQFIILDFTGKKPFVSKPFGYNPDNSFCLKPNKITWGEQQSYIYLEDPMKYLYHTDGSIIGPM